MNHTRKLLVALFAAGSLAAAGCGTDDAIERDVQDATEEIGKEGKEVGKDLENAAPGDADDDGK